VRDRLMRIGLAILAIGIAPLAIWATFFPRQFFDDFPGGGRHWVAVDGPYNEHLVRDVGALSLALLIVAVFALVTLSVPLVRATAIAFLVNGVLHVGYHVRHLSGFDTADKVGIVGGLVVAPIVGALLLVATLRREPGPSASASAEAAPVPG
jgi:hypothetical protein